MLFYSIINKFSICLGLRISLLCMKLYLIKSPKLLFIHYFKLAISPCIMENKIIEYIDIWRERMLTGRDDCL